MRTSGAIHCRFQQTALQGRNPERFFGPAFPDAQPGEGKIVADGIPRANVAEPAGNLQDGRQVRLPPPCQAERYRYPVEVRVQGNDELRCGDLFPWPRIHLVTPRHPAQEEVEPLAGAAVLGGGEETREVPFRECTQLSHESGERGKDGFVPWIQSFHKQSLQGPVLFQGALDRVKKWNHLHIPRETVDKAGETLRDLIPRSAPEEPGGTFPHRLQDPRHARQDLRHPAVREGGGDQADDLLILGRFIPVEKLQGVGMNVTPPIVGPVESVEVFAEIDGPARIA